MKKIAFAMETFKRYAGGAESYALSLATYLIKSGWEVHFFGEMWDGEPHSAFFHKIRVPKILPAWAKIVIFALKHKRMVERGDFDIILGFGNTLIMNVYQSHGGVHWLSTLRKVYSEKSRFRRVLKRIIIGLSIKQWCRAWIESAPFRLEPKPRIIAISDMIKKDMESFYHVDGSEVDIVYNGVDTARYNEALRKRLTGPLRDKLGISENDIVFLFVSYDLKKKGIEPLVEAAHKLRKTGKDNFKILIVGGSPYRSLSKLIETYDLEKEIIFTGKVELIEEFYANSDAFVLPTYYDACSLVVIEAMACGLPSITTTANGVSGIITDGKDGYIISHPPGSQELAEKMQLLLDHRKRWKMSQEALLTGQSYSAKKNHREMIRILGEVADLKG
jgi:UDP-glucose:(heptosyl)LPS alpha-1,3-glucosyltransferase